MLSHSLFGRLGDGRPVHEYVLDNGLGLCLRVLDYGGIVRELWAPDAAGRSANLVLGFDALGDYLAQHAVAMRVDIDARPDIASRYEDWGWPATVISLVGPGHRERRPSTLRARLHRAAPCREQSPSLNLRSFERRGLCARSLRRRATTRNAASQSTGRRHNN